MVPDARGEASTASSPDSSDRSVTMRDELADERDEAADSRDAIADVRHALADARESGADDRDRAADRRDEAAEVRDDVAGSRDRDADDSDTRLTHEAAPAPDDDARAPAGRSSEPSPERELDRRGRERAAAERRRDSVTRRGASMTRTAEHDARRQAAEARTKASDWRHEATDLRDQAGRQRLDELERRLTWSAVLAMLSAVPESIIATDPAGVIVYVNEQGESLFGWPKVELLGQHVRTVLPDGLALQPRDVRSATDPPSRRERQMSARRRDGTIFPAAISLSEADAGPERWLLAAIRDVTTALRFEHELVAARQEALAANVAKDEFLSRMSHELRTPLNAILGFGQLLAIDDLTADQVDGVAQIIGAGSHLLGLVDEVLDISQLAQGAMRLSLEQVALDEVVDEVIGMIRPLAERRHVRIRHTVNADVSIVGDRQRIKQVLTNLLANAIKYNRDGGTVHVASLTDEGRCRVTVTDTGLGIRADELDLLFKPFERLSSVSAEVEGTGLGLALAKLLVEVMGGTVGVTSEVGLGSSFWIELPYVGGRPIAAPRFPALPIDPTVARPTVAKTVLYVEDNPSNIRLLERVLDHRPEVRLVVATDGPSGLEAAFEHRPALVLLDLGLPGMTGEEVLRALKADPRSAAVPVVVISADAMPNRPAELRDLGAAGFITKPFDIARIFQLVDDLGREPTATDRAITTDPAPPGLRAFARAAGADTMPLDPVDQARMLELRSLYGSPARWRAYVEEFCADARARIGTLRTAARACDALAVLHAAHTLTGSCSLTGADRVVVVLDDMQHHARAGHVPNEAQLASLEAEYDDVEAILTSFEAG